MKIRGAVVEETGAPLAIQELDLGELRPDEVLVEIAASGICHTDLICRDQWLPVPLPPPPTSSRACSASGRRDAFPWSG